METAELVARHPDDPGKRQVVEHCRAEVEGLAHAGRISAEQEPALLRILTGACQPTA